MTVFEAHVRSKSGQTALAMEGGPSLKVGREGVPVAWAPMLDSPCKVIGLRPHKVAVSIGPIRTEVVSNQWSEGELAARDLPLFYAETGLALARGLVPA